MGRSRLVFRSVPLLIAAVAAAAPTPVSKETARIALACGRAWKLPLPTPPDDPLVREAAIDYLIRIVDRIEPKAKIGFPPVKVDTKRWPADPVRRDKLVRLVRGGYLAPFGPVVMAKPASRLRAADWGDAYAYALARCAERLHVPSPKYTPSIMD